MLNLLKKTTSTYITIIKEVRQNRKLRGLLKITCLWDQNYIILTS